MVYDLFLINRNTGIGVQEWGLGFQCLTLIANQKTGRDEPGDWLHVLRDPHFPEMILRFISGCGMNLQKTHVVSVRSL